jgi:hypothetical protein
MSPFTNCRFPDVRNVVAFLNILTQNVTLFWARGKILGLIILSCYLLTKDLCIVGNFPGLIAGFMSELTHTFQLVFT